MQTLTEKKFLEKFYSTKGHSWRKDKTSGRYLVYVYDESYKIIVNYYLSQLNKH